MKFEVYEEALAFCKNNPGFQPRRGENHTWAIVDRNGNIISSPTPNPPTPPGKATSQEGNFFGFVLYTDSKDQQKITVYRSVWHEDNGSNPKQAQLPDGTYYCHLHDDVITTSTVQEVLEEGIGRCLEWQLRRYEDNQDDIECWIDKQFKIDGLREWDTKRGHFLVDEEVFLEGLSTEFPMVALIEDKSLFIPKEITESVLESTEQPNILLIDASIFFLQGGELLRIEDLQKKSYSDSSAQTLETTHLLALSGENYSLLSIDLIVEHCAEYADSLTNNILNAMLMGELRTLQNTARKFISNSLHNFTYEGSFNKSEFGELEEIIVLPWLETLMGGFEISSRHQFYETIQKYSCVVKTTELSGRLKSLVSEEKGKPSYGDLLTLLDHIGTPSSGECFLFIFNYAGVSFLVGIPPKDLASEKNGDVPKLNVHRLDPVLLKTDLGQGNYLGVFYKHVATVHAHVNTYTIGDDFQFHIATFIEDATKEHLLNYDNNFLKEVLQSRSPRHDRRLLQMIGIPCRQALGDIFHDRMLKGLRPIPTSNPYGRTFQSRDNVTLETIKRYIEFDEDLGQVNGLDDLQMFLNEKKGIQFTLIEKMAILRKIASYSESLSNTPLAAVVDCFEQELFDQGHLLASQVCKSVQNYLNQEDTEQQTLKNLVGMFWKEIQECFPDDGSDWHSIPESEKAYGRHRYNTPPPETSSRLSVYSIFVLSALFDRQITTFYERFGKYNMPYDTMVWAINSVHRLQMLSVLLQMCCGDWVCLSKDIIQSRRLLWDKRIAGVTKPRGSNKAKGRIPDPQTNQTFTCIDSICHHPPPSAVLLAIGKSLHFNDRELNNTLQRMGWWFNALMDENMNHHFRCSCGMMMSPEGNNLKKFRCPLNGEEHDKEVYLIWCLDSHCDNIIDSRIDSKKCDNGYYICGKCGACCPEHQKSKV